MNELLALLIAYLLGSIPTAYLITRQIASKDIRAIGGGNIGGLNTFREVGRKWGIFVGVADALKGAAAVAIAYWLLDVSVNWVILAGLMAVIGHNWMVWLKFSGGKGMAAAIGGLLVIMPVYGYSGGLLIFAILAIVPLIITKNVALSMAIALLSLPVIVGFSTDSTFATLMAIALLLIIGFKFLPTMQSAFKEKGASGALGVDHNGLDGKQKEG